MPKQFLIDTEKTAFFAVFLFFCCFYFPWFALEGPVVEITDNLDGEIVVNHIIGQIYQGAKLSSQLALNGEVPVWALSRIMHPLSGLYALFDARIAYALTDVAVRCFGFIGVYLLSTRAGSSPSVASLLGLSFATSISSTIFLLSVAGIPLILWSLLEASKASGYRFILLLFNLIFIGSNVSFALAGVFLLVLALPIIIYGCNEKPSNRLLFAFTCLIFGIALGNSNLFYAQLFSDVTWHRSDFDRFTPPNYSLIYELAKTTKLIIDTNPWYHATYELSIAVVALVSFIVFFKNARQKNILFFVFLLCLILLIFIFAHTPLSDPLRQMSPLFRTFQWDRFYFLYSSIIFFALIFLFHAVKPSRFQSTLLTGFVFAQLLFNLFQNPHLKEPARIILGKTPQPTFDEYYKRKEYAAIKNVIGASPVLSVGIDPMIAPMNGIPSIDGYYVLYPLSFKRAFREVIAESMAAAGKADYYDKWGSRVYAFYPDGNPNLINYCAAYKLGARYVISKETISEPTLLEARITPHTKANYVYQILATKCPS
jgi:hypothetical protein